MAVTVGLAGAGHRATDVYAPALASCPGARFAGIWAPRAQATGPLAEKHGVTAYERFEQLLDHCDAVAFAVPPAAQPDLAGTAARRGKAVLLEVPIAVDPRGWVGMMLEHSGGRFSEVSLTPAAGAETPRADVEVFGSGGEAAIECEAAARQDAVETMVGEFVQAAEADRSHELDVNRGCTCSASSRKPAAACCTRRDRLARLARPAVLRRLAQAAAGTGSTRQ